MWHIEEILTLLFSKIASQSKIKNAIEKFGSFEQYIDFIKSPENKNIFGNSDIDLHLEKGKAEAQVQLEKAEKLNCKIISIFDSNYPELLKSIHSPPLVLYYQGELQNPDAMSISVVGTRKCTTYGKLVTEKFCEAFAKHNIIVTSGLATGIDTLAHFSTINNNGITYAVIASGLDCISNYQTKKNIQKIIEHSGAVLTEHKFGVNAKPVFFPQRNRIISGISLATLIVESDIKGGAMITARFAFDEGREVFAVPGNINSHKSRGTNYLIQQNIAKIATSAEDVLQEIGVKVESFIFEEDNIAVIIKDEIDREICEFLSGEPKHIDVIAMELKIEISELLVRLLNLEFNGLIKQLPGKYYIRL